MASLKYMSGRAGEVAGNGKNWEGGVHERRLCLSRKVLKSYMFITVLK